MTGDSYFTLCFLLIWLKFLKYLPQSTIKISDNILISFWVHPIWFLLNRRQHFQRVPQTSCVYFLNVKTLFFSLFFWSSFWNGLSLFPSHHLSLEECNFKTLLFYLQLPLNKRTQWINTGDKTVSLSSPPTPFPWISWAARTTLVLQILSWISIHADTGGKSIW